MTRSGSVDEEWDAACGVYDGQRDRRAGIAMGCTYLCRSDGQGFRRRRAQPLHLLLLALLLREHVLPRVVDRAVVVRVLPLRVREHAGRDEHADREGLCPHTRLHDLLRHRLVPAGVPSSATGHSSLIRRDVLVAHDDAARERHAPRPPAEDDLVLVVCRPILELLSRREVLPRGLLLLLLALDHVLARAGPCRLVVLYTAALGLDGVRREDDGDDTEHLELDGQGAVRGPFSLGEEGERQGDGEPACDALECPADGRVVVALKLFGGCELIVQGSVGYFSDKVGKRAYLHGDLVLRRCEECEVGCGVG